MKKSKVSKVLNREAPSFNWFAFIVIVDILMIFAIFLKDGRIEHIIGFLIPILVFIYIYYKCVEKKFLPKSPYDESILIAFASLGYLVYIAAFTYMFFVISDPDFKDISYIFVIVCIALHVTFILGFIEHHYIKKREARKRKQASEKTKRKKLEEMKDKIGKWKDEGYEVNDIEEIVDEVK